MLKYWKHLAATFVACLVLVLLAQPAEAAGGTSGAYTYELKGNGSLVITRFDWNKHGDGDVYIPRSIDGYNVTEIGPLAFSSASANKDHTVGNDVAVVLPDTITVIGEKAFFCTEISACAIPANVQVIGAGAFAGCPNLRRFSVNSQNRYFAIIDGALYNKYTKELVAIPLGISNTKLDVPSGIKSVGDYAFYGFSGSSENGFELIIPNTVTKIGNYSFYDVDSVYFHFPSSIVEVGDYAFAYTYVKQYANAEFAPEVIGDYAFFNASISIPSVKNASLHVKNLRHMGEGAFAYCLCTGDKFYLEGDDWFAEFAQSKLTVIPAHAFEGFDEPINLVYYDDSHKAHNSLPPTLVEIGNYAFADTCVTIILPRGVTTIQSHAFERANVDLGFEQNSTLRHIGDRAFYNARVMQWYDSWTTPSSQRDYSRLELPDSVEYLGYQAFHYASTTFPYRYSPYTSTATMRLTQISIPARVTFIGDEVVNRKYVVLEVTAGSYADLWASENGYPIEVPDDTSWLLE